MYEAFPLTIEPDGGAGTLTVMISGACEPLFSGRNAGSAGSESVGATETADGEVLVVFAEDDELLFDNSNAGTAIRVIAAATTRRRRSVRVSISEIRL
jgi:hypothetical protein